MKKWMILCLALFLCGVSTARADRDRAIDPGQMPARAQSLLRTYFSEMKVALAKVDSEWFETRYEVVLTDGTKLEFDRRGDWAEIACRSVAVPDDLIPEAIRQKVGELYRDVPVMKIERAERRGYEVQLSNRITLKFDAELKLIDID